METKTVTHGAVQPVQGNASEKNSSIGTHMKLDSESNKGAVEQTIFRLISDKEIKE
jgi:hypothetical protein